MNNLIEIRPGRRIHIAEYKCDPSRPTLFMIHGMGGRSDQWREQVSHLQDRYNIIVPDLLGQGESDKPRPEHDRPYDFEELRQDVQAIFDRYAGEKNVVMGHSYGGVFTVFLTKENRAKIQKMVLITPVNCQPFPHVPLVYLLPSSLLEYMRSSLDKSFEKLAFVSTDNPTLLAEEKKGRDLNPLYVIKGLLQGMQHIPSLSMEQMDVPSLIISGKADRLIPAAGVAKFYQSLPQHQLHVLENAAHMVHLEKSAEVNRLLDQFLA